MYRLATTGLLGLAALAGTVSLEVSGATPRLVVGIVVDQLRTDQIDQLQSLFGEKGFKVLMRDGAYLRDVDFKTPGLDASSGTAAVMTGSWPAYTGVPSALVFDSEIQAMRPPLARPMSNGSISNDSFTPDGLRLSTIADELAIASDGKAVIYSVAADPQQAVILAGHAATNAVWLNNTSGLWATSAYYGLLNNATKRVNSRTAPAHQIDTVKWRPLPATARLCTNLAKGPAFDYKFSSRDRDAYRKFGLSPAGNRAVTDMAVELISQMPADPAAQGMINVAYTVAPYKYSLGTGTVESTDACIRLDAQIGRLIEAVDKYCGKENALIWLTSTGYYDATATEDKRFRIPGGEFSVRRARSLLNSYLVARHGIGDYIASIRNGNVYLDSKSIEARNLDPVTIADEARQFLAQMSGVEQTFTRREILSPSSPETDALNLGYDPKYGGDVIIRLAPGWSVVDEDAPVASHQKPVRQMPVMTPAFIMTPGIPAQKIDTPVEAAALAPTLTDILRIRSPNGTRARSIPLQK